MCKGPVVDEQGVFEHWKEGQSDRKGRDENTGG